MLKALSVLMAFLPTLVRAVGVVVAVIELTEEGKPSGVKRQAAIAKLRELVDLKDAPSFVRDNFESVAGVLIDAVVAFCNRTGFFEKPSAQP